MLVFPLSRTVWKLLVCFIYSAMADAQFLLLRAFWNEDDITNCLLVRLQFCFMNCSKMLQHFLSAFEFVSLTPWTIRLPNFVCLHILYPPVPRLDAHFELSCVLIGHIRAVTQWKALIGFERLFSRRIRDFDEYCSRIWRHVDEISKIYHCFRPRRLVYNM